MYYFWRGVCPITPDHPGNSLCGHGLCQEAEAAGRQQVGSRSVVTNAVQGQDMRIRSASINPGDRYRASMAGAIDG